MPKPQTIEVLSGKAYHENNQAINIGNETKLQMKILGLRNQNRIRKIGIRTAIQNQTITFLTVFIFSPNQFTTHLPD